ncbi:MAG: hypothetical protein GF331_05425 [Chitinivibrionales bacterium]|nr:hypothetical protein [Chitinivibrionales bacterium]
MRIPKGRVVSKAGLAPMAAVLLCLLARCERRGGERDAGYADVEGHWVRTRESGRVVELEIGELGKYNLSSSGIVQSFPGEFSLSKGQVVFVDYYCGTSLPGVYSIQFDKWQGGKPVTFTLAKIEDEMCARKDMFPGEWKRK